MDRWRWFLASRGFQFGEFDHIKRELACEASPLCEARGDSVLSVTVGVGAHLLRQQGGKAF